MLFGGICYITDRRLSSLSTEDTVRKVLDSGISWIQYREKNLPRRDMYYQAEKLRKITGDYGATLIINDHADIALVVNADGVHLGQEDLPLKAAKQIMKGKVIGISTHDLNQAREALGGGADYIGYGPLFRTSTKNAGTPKGLMNLREIVDAVNIPVVAIGGIKRADLEHVFHHGASAVAVSSGIEHSDDTSREAREFVTILENISFGRRT
jgi:thiamine-phosphate pyrophosphorylase